MAQLVEAVARRGDAVFLLVGRLLVGWLFLPSGFSKLTGIGGPGLGAFAQTLAPKGLPVPLAWAVVAACIEFFGSLAIILGFRTRIVCLLMIAFTIAAALLSHNYWAVTEGRNLQYIQFWKNMAIVGGFLFLFVHGPGALSLDRRG